MKLKLIINADDFGISQSANEAIAYCFSKGLVTHTTLLINMPYAKEAIKIAKEEGFINRVGLHLNLYEGYPLNPSLAKFDDFGDEQHKQLKGNYCKSFAKRFIIPPSEGKEVEKELELQIQEFLKIRSDYLHIDSHRHSHTNPSIWKYCMPLFKKYNINSTRLTRNLYVPSQKGLKEIYKSIYNHEIFANGWSKEKWFGPFDDYKRMMDEHPELLRDGDCIELMCHPDFIDGKLINRGSHLFEKMEQYFDGMEFTTFEEQEQYGTR